MNTNLPEHVQANRSYWDGMADEWVSAGERNWAQEHPDWGIWGVSEEEADMLPDDMRGMRAIELGCGTGYVSAWMTRLGAEVVGIDNSQRQLATARRLMQEHGLQIDFVHGNAEQVPYPAPGPGGGRPSRSGGCRSDSAHLSAVRRIQD